MSLLFPTESAICFGVYEDNLMNSESCRKLIQSTNECYETYGCLLNARLLIVMNCMCVGYETIPLLRKYVLTLPILGDKHSLFTGHVLPANEKLLVAELKEEVAHSGGTNQLVPGNEKIWQNG